jgi:hypothetical protein
MRYLGWTGLVIIILAGLLVVEPGRWKECRNAGRSWLACSINVLGH